jgi:RimJ/RimL family protein N-acetyltransferase
VIETDRLLLRQLRRSDLDWYARLLGDPLVTRYLGPPRSGPAQSLERMIRTYEADGFGHLAVVRKDDGAALGRCGLLVWEVDPWRPSSLAEATGETEVEIGWVLGHEHWGHGYATEAALAVQGDAFERLGLPRLVSIIHPDNRASIRVAEKLGMGCERTIETRLGRVLLYAVSSPARAPRGGSSLE